MGFNEGYIKMPKTEYKNSVKTDILKNCKKIWWNLRGTDSIYLYLSTISRCVTFFFLCKCLSENSVSYTDKAASAGAYEANFYFLPCSLWLSPLCCCTCSYGPLHRACVISRHTVKRLNMRKPFQHDGTQQYFKHRLTDKSWCTFGFSPTRCILLHIYHSPLLKPWTSSLT